MKILVIQQKMIGDVLVSSIICNNLKANYPEAQIDYLVYNSTTAVLEGNPNIDNLILFEDKHRSSKKELFKLGLKIREEKYDLLIDAYSKLESWILVLMSNAKRRISYRKPLRNFLYTDTIPFAENPQTNLGLAIERRLSLLSPLHLLESIDPFPKLFVSEDERQHSNLLFAKHGLIQGLKTVMVSLLGSDPSKTYPLEYMAKVVDQIAEQDVNILFNYFPSQIKQATAILHACKPKTQQKVFFNLLGVDLREFISIMSICDLVIGNDGGAINMAKALNKPSFIIFSPWIEKKIWATFEDGKKHVAVHLKDYSPDLFENKSEKELKKEAIPLYDKFKPEYFLSALQTFLSKNL